MSYSPRFQFSSHVFKRKDLHEGSETAIGEDTGQLTTPVIGGRAGISSQGINKFSFFNPRIKHGFFETKLKPELSQEEKDLLMSFLKELDLNFDEFKLKLQEMKMTVKVFIHKLKENMLQFSPNSAKVSADLILDLRDRGLLAETLFEKLDKKLQAQQQKAEAEKLMRPNPFATRPRPYR